MTEQELERDLINRLVDLKYTYRPDIRDRAALEKNFRQKFEELNRVHLTDAEFERLVEEIRFFSHEAGCNFPQLRPPESCSFNAPNFVHQVRVHFSRSLSPYPAKI